MSTQPTAAAPQPAKTKSGGADELPKTYDPAVVEPEANRVWTEEKLFHAEPSNPGDPYAIVIPPPNVTAALHLGHALNNTIQDILTRQHRMMGDNTCWLPGTDHAGIATQTVVDKRLQAEGQPALKDYKALEAKGERGRERFIEKVQAWKDEYERRITEQLKAMGCSCDYDRQAFTMDPPRAKAVREAFFRLFKDGLIYRGKRLVNWDPVSQTALSDDEVEMEEVDGHFYYLRYPLVEEGEKGRGGEGETNSRDATRRASAYVTVATTRPETMLGDTAVAINPKDPRAPLLRGKKVLLPIVNREIPVVEDEYVVLPIAHGGDPADIKAQFATGFLKVTPAHDPNDYDIGRRHNLATINVMAPDASISDRHGWPADDVAKADPFLRESILGQSREEARKRVVDWFKRNGLLEEVKPYKHSVGHSYRSHVPIEPYLSDQWYCKVTDPRLAGAALRAMAPDQFTPSPLVGEGGGEGENAGLTSGAGSQDNGQGTSAKQPASTSDANPLIPALSHEGRGGESLRFYPARYAKTFQTWHENIRDWCISRQLWWGHRIPVWTCKANLHHPDFPLLHHPEGIRKERKRLCEALISAFQQLAARFEHQGDFAFIIDDYRVRICARTQEAEQFLQRIIAYKGSLQAQNAPGTIPAGRFGFSDEEERAVLQLMAFVYEFEGQDPDVLDTWFSSGLWPLSTLNWPEDTAELREWNPSSVLCTAREIITLWVSRMVMFNLYFRGCLPFRDVFIHAMIQDGEGQKMSKTLGNGVDPLDIIEGHGADAMRFTLTSMTTQTQDLRVPVDLVDPHSGQTFTPQKITLPNGYVVAAPIQASPKDPSKKMVSSFGVISGQAKPTKEMPPAKNTSSKFDLGRNFCNKLWNASRFAFANLSTQPVASAVERHSALSTEAVDEQKWSMADRWIVSRFNRTVAEVNDALRAYRFDYYAKLCYDFFWRDFCDWYLEAIKPAMRDPARAGQTANVLAAVLDGSLRLMHPMIPFITEFIYWQLNDLRPERGLPGRIELPPSPRLVTAKWPTVGDFSQAAEFIFPKLQELIGAIRQVRNDYNVPPKQPVTVSVLAPGDSARQIESNRELIETLATCKLKDVRGDLPPVPKAAKTSAAGCEVYVEGLIDESAEQQRVAKRREELTKKRTTLRGRLDNESYIAKAPPKLVEQTKQELAEVEAELAKLG